MATSTQLAKTTFQTGISDKLAAVDVYTQTTAAAPINVAGLTSFDPKQLTSMIGGNLGISALISKYSAKVGIQINAQALIAGVIGASPSLRSALGSMSGSVSAAVTSTTGVSANIRADIAGVVSTISNTNLNDLVSVSAMIGGLNGTSFGVNFTDVAGLKTLSVNLLNQANQMGIPNAYTQFALGMSNNPSLLASVTMGILPGVVATGNINMLANIAAGPVARQVHSQAPNFLKNFAANFSISIGTPPSQYPSMAASIRGSYASINPNWGKTKTSKGSRINNLNIMLNASVDFKKLLNSAASYTRPMISTAPTVNTTYPTGVTPPESVPTYTFPAGTTSVTTTNADGSSSTTYSQPDGEVYTTTKHTDGSTSTVWAYPPQGQPDPLKGSGLPAAHDTIGEPSGYGYGNLDAEDTQVNYTPTPQAPYASYPSGTLCTRATTSGGAGLEYDQTPDGSQLITTTYPNGTVARSAVINDPTGSYLTTATGDPLASSSKYAISDSMIYGAAMNNLADKSSAAAANNNQPDLMRVDADEALAHSFPDTYLEDTGKYDQDW